MKSESGMDELMRLSQQMVRSAQAQTKVEQANAQKRQKIQGIQQGLKEINISVAEQQLKSLASSEILRKVGSLRNKKGTADLRKLIIDLASDLESRTCGISNTNINAVAIGRSVKTLAILIELLFSLE